MKQKNYLFLICMTIPLIAKSQEVITTSGGSMTNNNVQVNFTIGEPVIESVSNNTTIVSSGFNQPYLKVITSVENINEKLSISVYPNPTSQFVTVKFDREQPLYAKILSANGAVIYTIDLKDHTTNLDFSNNVVGVYFIEITDKSGSSNTYKIIKQ